MPGPTLAHRIRTEAHAVWLAARDPRTPIAAKLVGLLVAAYALSPIDLIPDFIPVIGLLDDAILIPIGIWLFERLVPADLMTEHRARAAIETERPVSLFGILIVVAIWAACAWLVYSIVATSGYE
ncbi:YkvA family protein [Sphingomonas sp.]|uniref:YkvA family protein n=1 Tax=Sphingomonas sp. TaxID=28214 RepID=UPI0025EEDC00|nr:YkvA family protein [Sphingomonas sp.]